MSCFWQAMSGSVTYYFAVRAISGSVVCVAVHYVQFVEGSFVAVQCELCLAA